MAEKLNLEQSNKYYQEALELIPGAILGIRRPYNFVVGEYPIFLKSAVGGNITDVDGNEYIDMLCAYGPIIIGHKEKEIDDAVIAKIQNDGFCMSLTQPVQNELAKKMRELIPSAEMSLFLKTGSDATTTAIRIARSYTDKVKVARCGYHGWHDWCVEVKEGVPEKLWEDVYGFPYNNIEALEELMKEQGEEMAAIIITPVGHPLAKPVEEPKPGYLEAVKALAEKYGAVLIFDEIRTGFRYSLGGAQAYYGVTPHLSVFGKAMANGYPISAVVGKKEIMSVVADKVFISSTFFANSLEQVAALKTIEILERDNILDQIRMKGTRFCEKLEVILAESGVNCSLSGAPLMPFVSFEKEATGLYKKLRKEFYTQVIRRGVFLQPYHHGYIAFRHTDEDLDRAAEAIKAALVDVKKMM